MNIMFKYSHIYEKQLNPEAAPLSTEEIESIISQMDMFWKDFGSLIEETFKEITGLEFKQKQIICYLNSTKCFSDPLTLKIEEIHDMQDNLVHELIHVLLSDNKSGQLTGWKKLVTKYEKEKPATKVHIIVHAIHLLVAKVIFSDRIERIKSYSVLQPYVRSWKIVEEEGAQAIVDSIFK